MNDNNTIKVLDMYRINKNIIKKFKFLYKLLLKLDSALGFIVLKIIRGKVIVWKRESYGLQELRLF